MCQRALTRKRTLWAGGALEIGDLRLLEDGSERSDALVSDLIQLKTASKERGGNGGRASVSTGADKKSNASRGSGALEVGDLRLLEDSGERGGTLGSDAVVCKTASEGKDGKR